MSASQNRQLFPEFERFVKKTNLDKKKGANQVRINRILGSGKSSAKELDIPPAMIERQEELLRIAFPLAPSISPELQKELDEARKFVSEHENKLGNRDLRRRFALKILSDIKEKFEVKTGFQDNHFYAGRFVLVEEKNGKNWSWSMTPHYPIITKIPADEEYIILAYGKSVDIVKENSIPTEEFERKLTLSWKIAKLMSQRDEVLIADVARIFKLAAQSEKFWADPLKNKFKDIPDAIFTSNLINWHRDRNRSEDNSFKLVPATLSQAHGPKAKSYYVPTNAEGTAVKPMIYIQHTKQRNGGSHEN